MPSTITVDMEILAGLVDTPAQEQVKYVVHVEHDLKIMCLY